MDDDAALLRDYATTRAEPAFAVLVQRHLDLVYFAALRRCSGDAHRAEDVTQQVFTALARNANALAEHAVLAGWLYVTTRNIAAKVVRAERTRRAREAEAQAMSEAFTSAGVSSPHPTTAESDWERLRPVLDSVIDELGERDRDAVLLRFFENRPFAEIGAALRVTEDAARMRVERALDKLHVLLARRGVTSTAAALGLALAGQAGVAAPAGLAASATAAALAGGGVLAGGAGWMTFMSMTKLQWGIASAVAVAGATGYVVQGQTNAELRREISVVRAQQTAIVALRTENQRLASAAAEVEILRRDDGELKQLEQRVAEVKKANEEKARLAQAQARVQARRDASARLGEQDRLVQLEVDRMNREGNALVAMYKDFSTRERDESLSMETRAEAAEVAKKKLTEIRRKQAEVQAYIRAKQLELGAFVEKKAVFHDNLSPGGWSSSVPGVIGPAERGASTAPSGRDWTVKSVPQP